VQVRVTNWTDSITAFPSYQWGKRPYHEIRKPKENIGALSELSGPVLKPYRDVAALNRPMRSHCQTCG
jgi:hypothetical protein